MIQIAILICVVVVAVAFVRAATRDHNATLARIRRAGF